MPALHGIRLALDAASARALAPWLDREPVLSRSPTIAVEVLTDEGQQPPTVLGLIAEERAGWLGRTESGFVLGNRERAWFAIEGSPLRVRGVLGDGGDATRELLLAALLVVLRSLGVHGVHAAAVSCEEQALLLVGDSGAGKSTTATALVNVGCRYLGDDGILIRQRLNDVELLPLWSSFCLTDLSLSSFEALRPYAAKAESEEKWRLNTQAAFPNRFLSHWFGRKTLLFLGRSSGVESSLLPLTHAEALGLLMSQSHALSLDYHPDPRRHLDLLAQLVRVAHFARLELGTEWLSAPAAAAQRLLDRTCSVPRSDERRFEAS